MNINKFQKINAKRAKIWHSDISRPWSLLEWAGAMCGESGEAANFAKKILRIELGSINREWGVKKNNLEELKIKLAKETADSIIYGLLILSELGVEASEIIADVFDNKSIEYEFSERAPR